MPSLSVSLTDTVFFPKRHGNKTEDGEVDQRTQSGEFPGPQNYSGASFCSAYASRLWPRADHGFGGDKQLAHDAGVKGGSYGGEQYKRDNAGDFTDASTKLE